jgi:hypothetical protein
VDLVVDANVLAHAANPNVDYFASSLEFVMDAFESDLRFALDDTGKNAPVLACSHLYKEYLECIPPGSLSRMLLQFLSEAGRIEFYRRPKRDVWDACVKLVPRNHGDAIVLGIGSQCESNTIVSNDYDDFNNAVRRKVQRRLHVRIIDSDELSKDV